MNKIHLSSCYVVGVKADLVKSRMRLTLETNFDEEVLAAKRKLAMLSIEEMAVSVDIVPWIDQGELFPVNIVHDDRAESGDD